MFREGHEVVRGVRHLLPFDSEIQSEMLEESRELIFASVAVALVIALMQGALGGLAFTLVGSARRFSGPCSSPFSRLCQWSAPRSSGFPPRCGLV